MNPRFRTGLIIAIVGFFLIALGIFGAIRFLNLDITGSAAKIPPTPVAETTVSVVFAANDIAAGTAITANDVKLSEVPIQFAPEETMTKLDDVVGKISKTDLAKGQMVLQPNLADPTGSAHDVAYILDDKHVLIAMPATDLMSREAIIQRGDVVDILVTIQESLEPATTTQGGDTQQTAASAATPSAPQQVTFNALQKTNITAMVVDVVKNDKGQAVTTDSANPPRDQVVVQAYLLAMEPQDALVIKYLKDMGANFEFVIRARTSTGQFELTPVTSKFIKELYGLELLP